MGPGEQPIALSTPITIEQETYSPSDFWTISVLCKVVGHAGLRHANHQLVILEFRGIETVAPITGLRTRSNLSSGQSITVKASAGRFTQ